MCRGLVKKIEIKLSYFLLTCLESLFMGGHEEGRWEQWEEVALKSMNKELLCQDCEGEITSDEA